MDGHIINGNYEIQSTPWFWSVEQIINAYEWCLCVRAHERVFAKPTHQLPGPEKTDGVFGMRPGSEEVWILELWKHALITLSSWQLEEPDGRFEKWLIIRTKQWWSPLQWHCDAVLWLRMMARNRGVKSPWKRLKNVLCAPENYIQWVKNARCLSLRHRHILRRNPERSFRHHCRPKKT